MGGGALQAASEPQDSRQLLGLSWCSHPRLEAVLALMGFYIRGQPLLSDGKLRYYLETHLIKLLNLFLAFKPQCQFYITVPWVCEPWQANAAAVDSDGVDR